MCSIKCKILRTRKTRCSGIIYLNKNFFYFKCSTKTYNNDQANNINTWPFWKSEQLILNLAIGGTWGGAQGIDDSIFP